jgi:hypothetical protein
MKDTGGPAFPANHFDLAENEHGMTLRDYFAVKAMQGMLSARNPILTKIADIAEGAYEMADAMLAERSKK